MEILNNIWTNNQDLVSDINISDWSASTNHKLVTANLAYWTEVLKENLEEMHITASGSGLKKLKINKAD